MDLPPMRPSVPVMVPPLNQQIMTGIEQPSNNDVLCGRGVTTNRHPGNESFRSLVNCNKELYVSSTKKQKMKISRSIVEAVRSLDPQGRFLEKDPTSALWFDIGDKKAVEKTSQALRDGAAHLRKQLSEDLGDPDFLSAVFDMDVSPEKKPAPAKKVEKKTPPKKGHRRTKSNPSVGTTLRMVKKMQKHNDVPMSPRTISNRHSASIPMIPKPPQSPMPMSPRSGGVVQSVGLSPRPLFHHAPMPSDARSHGGHHRRAYSQGSAPFLSAGMSGGSPSFGPASRTNSFEYAPEHNGERPFPASFGSPSQYRYPRSPSPSQRPPSPRGYHHHHHRPYPHQPPPVSPRWSPRSGYARSHAGPPPSSSHSFSPYPPMPPPSNEYQQHRASPVFCHNHRSRSPPVSPREQYAPRPPQNHYPPSGGGGHHPLAVPSLGGEAARPPSPRYRQQLPSSPVSRTGQHSDSPLPIDFTPPTAFNQPQYEITSEEHREIMDDDVYFEERKDERQEELKQRPAASVAPFDEQTSKASPSAVADVATSSIAIEKPIQRSPSTEDGYPSDEDPAADDDDSMFTPLPLDHKEDPSSLMDLPENILSLPISPCGPNDAYIEYGEI